MHPETSLLAFLLLLATMSLFPTPSYASSYASVASNSVADDDFDDFPTSVRFKPPPAQPSAPAPSVVPPSRQCQPIQVPLCKAMRYNATSMPNHFGHTQQAEADAMVQNEKYISRIFCLKKL